MFRNLALTVFVLCALANGCATPPEEVPVASAGKTAQPDAAPPPAKPVKLFTTGSRLPSYDSDGSNYVIRADKDAYQDEMNRRAKPYCAECF